MTDYQIEKHSKIFTEEFNNLSSTYASLKDEYKKGVADLNSFGSEILALIYEIDQSEIVKTIGLFAINSKISLSKEVEEKDKQIAQIRSEKNHMKQQIADLQAEVRLSRAEEVKIGIPIVWNRSFNQIILKEGDELRLNLGNPNDHATMVKLSTSKLPNMKLIKIDNAADDDADLKVFFSKAMPDKLEEFYFNWTRSSEKLPFNNYAGSTTIFLQKITKVAMFVCCTFSSKDFSDTMTACRKIPYVGFAGWTIDSSDLDLGFGLNYEIKTLNFQMTGLEFYSNWVSDYGKFSRVIEAISETKLKDSLTRIQAGGIGVTFVNAAQEIVNGFKLTNIQVADEIINEP